MGELMAAAIGAFLISGAFGVLYGLRSPRIVVAAGVVGAVGMVAFRGATMAGGAEASASLAGAVALSIAGWIAVHLTDRPIVTYTAPALIPLVPGGDVYRMMVCFLQEKVADGLGWGLQALAVAGMLTLGLVLVSSVPYAWRRLHEGSRRLRRR